VSGSVILLSPSSIPSKDGIQSLHTNGTYCFIELILRGKTGYQRALV